MHPVSYVLVCILCFTVSFSENQAPKEPTKSYLTAIEAAEARIDWLTPGIFSVREIKALNHKSRQGVKIRLISDTSYLYDSSNFIGNLAPKISLRIVDKKHHIPHSILIIDHKTAYFGGDLPGQSKYFQISPRVVQAPSEVETLTGLIQQYWLKTSEKGSRILLKKSRFEHDIDLISSNGKPAPLPQVSDRKAQNSRFVASKNSKVYHKIDSPSVKRIKTANRIYFASENAASKSGRRRAASFKQ